MRCRLRTLLVLVGVLAVFLGVGLELWRRHQRYHGLYLYHDSRSQQIDVPSPWTPDDPDAKLILWHEMMASRYKHAASRPWVTVAEESPPTPEAPQ